jgi:hypothetical protein
MKLIPLTQSKFAMVDDEDYENVCKYKWNFSVKGRNINARVDGKAVCLVSFLFGSTYKNRIKQINGNKLDLRKENNIYYPHNADTQGCKPKKETSSKYCGVTWKKQINRWVSQVKHNREMYYIGCYKDEVEAAKAYNIKALELFGENARLNIIY